MDALAKAVDELLGARGSIRAAWNREPALVAGGPLSGLLPRSAEVLAAPMLRPPFLTVHADGDTVPTARYCRTERIVNFADAERILDHARLNALLNGGAAVKFNRMELWHPAVATVAAAIGTATAKQVKVWGFLSARDQMVVPAHRDPAHVIAAQIEGSKHWVLGGPCPAGPWSAMAHPEVTEPAETGLAPGDVLYLPYGYAHCAAAETASSFHISFALEGTTAGELRHRIVKHVADRLDGSDATEVRPDTVQALLTEVAGALTAAAEAVQRLSERDLSDVYAGRTAGVLDDLLS